MKKIISPSSQFIIPVFQRDYKWEQVHCRQLWHDILRSADSTHQQGHFLGSIVYIPTEDAFAGFPRYLLIDGQQRITSVSILLAALRDHIAATKWQGSTNGPTVSKIDANFLINITEDDQDQRRKLRLRRQDDATLAAIISGGPVPELPSDRIMEAYEEFADLVTTADPEKVWVGINRLVIVDVSLTRGIDDPQLVFESLNSTGKDLSVSDLIRNFILMRLGEREQTRLHHQFWSRIEALFSGSDHAFDAFVRDYIAFKRKAAKQDKAEALYSTFRDLWHQLTNTERLSVDHILADMKEAAEDHAAFSLLRGVDGEIRAAIGHIRNLSDVPAILVARLLHYHRRAQTLPKEQLLIALQLIESYLVRRAVGKMQARNYWQYFANLAYAIKEDRPLDSLKIGFARLPNSYSFPYAFMFDDSLHSEDIYSLRICRHLLERLENHDSREPSALDNCSIEHILPQNPDLRPEWREMLGENWRDIQKESVHRLGNLTLTAYNTKYSDLAFEKKKTMKDGFNDSAVRLNRFVREQTRWTKVEIDKRTALLAEECFKVWPDLNVPEALLQEARKQDLRDRAAQSASTPVVFPDRIKPVADKLIDAITALGPDVVTIHHKASVSFHAPDFFVEVIPRARRVTVILPLQFVEIKNPPDFASDTADYAFIHNSHHDAGTLLSLSSLFDVQTALPLVQQAYISTRART